VENTPVPLISVPGSISNLGPGFDALSVAVELYTRVRVVAVRPEKPDTMETRFVDASFTGENRIETAFRRARETRGVSAPGVCVEVTSDIPRRAGLGSSAAAAIAGVKLYEALTSPLESDKALSLATEIEGHPDNAAAALLGGFTVSCQHDDGHVTARAWTWPDRLRFVVATPDVPLETAYARSLVPDRLPTEDAVFNLQRAVLLVRALETGEDGLLREALRDRWHQPHRAAHVPGLVDALSLNDPALLGVFLSGAGPSIAAIARERDTAPVVELLRGVYDRQGLHVTIRTLRATQVHSPDQKVRGSISA
jgi:homoserine kinase